MPFAAEDAVIHSPQEMNEWRAEFCIQNNFINELERLPIRMGEGTAETIAECCLKCACTNTTAVWTVLKNNPAILVGANSLIHAGKDLPLDQVQELRNCIDSILRGNCMHPALWGMKDYYPSVKNGMFPVELNGERLSIDDQPVRDNSKPQPGGRVLRPKIKYPEVIEIRSDVYTADYINAEGRVRFRVNEGLKKFLAEGISKELYFPDHFFKTNGKGSFGDPVYRYAYGRALHEAWRGFDADGFCDYLLKEIQKKTVPQDMVSGYLLSRRSEYVPDSNDHRLFGLIVGRASAASICRLLDVLPEEDVARMLFKFDWTQVENHSGIEQFSKVLVHLGARISNSQCEAIFSRAMQQLMDPFLDSRTGQPKQTDQLFKMMGQMLTECRLPSDVIARILVPTNLRKAIEQKKYEKLVAYGKLLQLIQGGKETRLNRKDASMLLAKINEQHMYRSLGSLGFLINGAYYEIFKKEKDGLYYKVFKAGKEMLHADKYKKSIDR